MVCIGVSGLCTSRTSPLSRSEHIAVVTLVTCPVHAALVALVYHHSGISVLAIAARSICLISGDAGTRS